MQVTLIAPSSRQFSIESTNPEVILLWMTEYVPQISGEWRMRIWFSNESEARMFGTPYMTDEQMTRQGFLKIANLFQRAEREPTESKKKLTNNRRSTQSIPPQWIQLGATMNEHCGDQSPHPPHTYWGPSPNPKETKQVQYHCPGTSSYVPRKKK